MATYFDLAIMMKNPPTEKDIKPLVKGSRIILAPIETEGFADNEEEEWQYLPTEFEVESVDGDELTGYMITYDKDDKPIRTYGEPNLAETPILFYGTLEDLGCAPIQYPYEEEMALDIIKKLKKEIYRLKLEALVESIPDKETMEAFDIAEEVDAFGGYTELGKDTIRALENDRDEYAFKLDTLYTLCDEDTQVAYHNALKEAKRCEIPKVEGKLWVDEDGNTHRFLGKWVDEDFENKNPLAKWVDAKDTEKWVDDLLEDNARVLPKEFAPSEE